MRDPFEQVHDFVEALLARRRPKRFRVETSEDWLALKAAARLAAEADPAQGEPTAEFLANLERALLRRARESGEGANQRRRLLIAGLAGLASGLSAAIGLSRAVERPSQPAPPTIPLVRENGRWYAVAQLSQLPQNVTLRFTAGALEGHLVRRGDEVLALSAICSHMPCTLLWQEGEGHFLCPCHDASFHPSGDLKFARRPYPPLTRLEVKVEGDTILVWSIGEDHPRQEGTPL